MIIRKCRAFMNEHNPWFQLRRTKFILKSIVTEYRENCARIHDCNSARSRQTNEIDDLKLTIETLEGTIAALQLTEETSDSITRAQAVEIRGLENLVADLSAQLHDAEPEIEMRVDENGIEVDMKHWAVRSIAASMADTLGECASWASIEIGPVAHPKGDFSMMCTIKRMNGTTPEEKVTHLKKLLKELVYATNYDDRVYQSHPDDAALLASIKKETDLATYESRLTK